MQNNPSQERKRSAAGSQLATLLANPVFGSAASLLAAGSLLSSAAWAQTGYDSGTPEPAPSNAALEEEANEDWCERWKKMGTLHKDADHPYIQEWKVFGRLHAQFGYLDGTGSGDGVSYDTDEIRRFRFGTSAKFLDYWKVSGEAEIFRDGRPAGGDREFDFKHMWHLNVTLDAKKAFGAEDFDALKFGYGAREINMAHEWNVSSKRIKTVERSAIANKIWAFNSEFANPTGIWVQGKNDPVDWTLGYFSTAQDDYLAPWNEGELIYTNLLFDLGEGEKGEKSKLRWTAFSQDIDTGDEVLAGGLDWATSVSWQYIDGPFEMVVEGIMGDNGDQSSLAREGDFWGAVLMPSYWVEDDLELVGRLQIQNADEPEGIRLNSRYIRRAGAREGIGAYSNGRGDEHISIYAGVNKLLCGHNHKLMLGVEYDDLDSDGSGIVSGTTYFLAYRTYF